MAIDDYRGSRNRVTNRSLTRSRLRLDDSALQGEPRPSERFVVEAQASLYYARLNCREVAQRVDPWRKREEELRREKTRVEKSNERPLTAFPENARKVSITGGTAASSAPRSDSAGRTEHRVVPAPIHPRHRP